MLKVYAKTMGCQMNVHDSERLLALLSASHQMQIAGRAEDADLLLLNTCSVREKAQEKVFSQLGRWAALKQRKPSLVIAVGGCVASQEGDALCVRAPCVDMVFGPQTLHRVPDMFDAVRYHKRRVVDVSFPEIEKFDRLPEPQAQGATAWVSIMEGCSKYCSFCVVPYTRGEEVSRPFDDVITEIVQLARQGVREITLLGQNVNAWRGQRHDGCMSTLAELIEHAAVVEGIDRIRFTTSHPAEFSADLIAIYGRVPQLADHLHLPIQSGSDRILMAMKRNYTALEYKHKVRTLRRLRPRLSLSSDFIVGFPGETDADFAATMDCVETIGFDHAFSFLYSPRPGTPAASLPDDDTPLAVKKQRLATLQERINQRAAKLRQGMEGRIEQVLVDGHAKKNRAELSGRTSNNLVVNFAGPEHLIGGFVPVVIGEARAHSLRGHWCQNPTNRTTEENTQHLC